MKIQATSHGASMNQIKGAASGGTVPSFVLKADQKNVALDAATPEPLDSLSSSGSPAKMVDFSKTMTAGPLAFKYSTKTKSRLIGKIGKIVSKVPKVLFHTTRFIGATLVGGLSAAIQLAAGSLGLVGMAGLGLAGGLEIRDGIREKDAVKVVSGSGEIVRGAYTGVLSAGQLMDLGRFTGIATVATMGLGALQGALYTTSGLMKFVQGRSEHDKRRKLEGMLEMGMGTAGFAMLAAPITPLALGVYGGLAAARYLVVNKERIQEGWHKTRDLAKNYWNTVKSEFQGTSPGQEPPSIKSWIASGEPKKAPAALAG